MTFVPSPLLRGTVGYDEVLRMSKVSSRGCTTIFQKVLGANPDIHPSPMHPKYSKLAQIEAARPLYQAFTVATHRSQTRYVCVSKSLGYLFGGPQKKDFKCYSCILKPLFMKTTTLLGPKPSLFRLATQEELRRHWSLLETIRKTPSNSAWTFDP